MAETPTICIEKSLGIWGFCKFDYLNLWSSVSFFFSFFFSFFPNWMMCTFREHKENWQIKEVSSFVPLRLKDVGALCVISMASSGEAGTKRLRTQGLNVHLLHGTWQKCLDEQSFRVIPPFSSLYWWSASASSENIWAIQNHQWWPAWPWNTQRQLQNSAAEDKVGLLKVLQTLHSYQVTI